MTREWFLLVLLSSEAGQVSTRACLFYFRGKRHAFRSMLLFVVRTAGLKLSFILRGVSKGNFRPAVPAFKSKTPIKSTPK